MDFAENVLFGRYVACYDDQRLGSLSTRNTIMVLDMIRNSIIYEPLARSDDYLTLERLSLTILASTLDGFLLTHLAS